MAAISLSLSLSVNLLIWEGMLAVVVSSVRASETMLAVSEVSGVLAARTHAFLLRQFLAIWPCLSHLKQRPSFLYFSLSASVMAFQAVALVSIALGSLGGSCCTKGHPGF